jgi:hypothetical protein
MAGLFIAPHFRGYSGAKHARFTSGGSVIPMLPALGWWLLTPGSQYSNKIGLQSPSKLRKLLS